MQNKLEITWGARKCMERCLGRWCIKGIGLFFSVCNAIESTKVNGGALYPNPVPVERERGRENMVQLESEREKMVNLSSNCDSFNCLKKIKGYV